MSHMRYPDEESAQLEFKSDLPDNHQIVKTIIGFCNQNGGKLIVGVDNQRNIIGIPEEKLQNLLEYLDKMIFESSAPPLLPRIYAQRFGEKNILIVEISSGMNKPYYLKSEGLEKGTYIRLGRSTMRATADMIEELKWQSRGRVFDMMPVYHAKEEELDEAKILQFLKMRAGKQARLTQEMLRSYHLMIQEHHTSYPTVGGMLLFGKNALRFFPEAFILCSHFKGNKGREAVSTIDCQGTLFEQFDTAYAFISSRLSRSFSIRGARREEHLEIPEIAIREILLNAIVHRNYHINSPIKIAIYDNRIEIFSPGVFPGPLDVRNLKSGLTYIRNFTICKVMREAGYIEKLGSGFAALFQSYEEAKLKTPEVIEGENYIKCILPREKLTVTLSTDDLAPILALFDSAEELSISDVMTALHMPRATAGRKIAQLVEKNMLKRKGKGKSSRYYRPPFIS